MFRKSGQLPNLCKWPCCLCWELEQHIQTECFEIYIIIEKQDFRTIEFNLFFRVINFIKSNAQVMLCILELYPPHNCFQKRPDPGHCPPDLYNGKWLLTNQKTLNSAKIKYIYEEFLMTPRNKLGQGAFVFLFTLGIHNVSFRR